jgi:hypothetical protein
MATSTDVHDATLECLAACQASIKCKFWTVDVPRRICELKESNKGEVPSNSTISGAKICDSFQLREDFWCDKEYCDPYVEITSTCGDYFSVQILEGDFGSGNEYANVYINDRYISRCDPADWYKGYRPSWFSCGSFSIPDGDSFKVQLHSSYVAVVSTYNGVPYSIYGRVSMNCKCKQYAA